jgi:hypothetical protein
MFRSGLIKSYCEPAINLNLVLHGEEEINKVSVKFCVAMLCIVKGEAILPETPVPISCTRAINFILRQLLSL